jgi:tetratricopeptide (TPR) repeat protein
MAKAAVDEAMRLDPDLGESWTALGSYRYRVLRDYPAALEAFHESLKRLPNDAIARQLSAFLERRLDQWEKGLDHYREAMTLDPRNIGILHPASGAFLIPMRRFAEAQALIDRELELVPGDASALASKALCFQAEGRLAEAAEQLAKIPESSNDETFLTARPRQFALERRFDEAVKQMETTIKRSSKPEEPLVGDTIPNLTLLGYYQEWAGRNAEARETWERIIKTVKPTPDAVVPVTPKKLPCFLALAYAGLGEKDKALDQARRAIQEYQTDSVDKPIAEETLAQIQARFGNFDAALAALPHLLEVPGPLTRGLLRIDPIWDPLRKDRRFQKLANASEKKH